MYLDNNFQSVLPRCEFSTFKSREIDADNFSLEMDSFSYMTKLGPRTSSLAQWKDPRARYLCGSTPANHQETTSGAPRHELRSSPGAVTVSLEKQADKFIIGEAYSGQGREKMGQKVIELETKLEKMRTRHNDLSEKKLADVTSSFGAAILIFT